MLVLGEPIEIRHDLRCQDPIFQTLEENNNQRAIQCYGVFARIQVCHNSIVMRRERPGGLNIIDHQIIVRGDIKRRIEHRSIGHRSREMSAIDRFTMLTNKRHSIVFRFGLRVLVFIINIECFRSQPQPNGYYQHNKPCLPAAFGPNREEIDASKKSRHSIEQKIYPPLYIDEYRPEIAMQVAGHIECLGIQQNMVIAHINEIRHKPCIYDKRKSDKPSFVMQQESKRSEEHCCCQFGEEHSKDILDRRLQLQFAESEMVKEQGLNENKQGKQTEDDPVCSIADRQPLLDFLSHTLAIQKQPAITSMTPNHCMKPTCSWNISHPESMPKIKPRLVRGYTCDKGYLCSIQSQKRFAPTIRVTAIISHALQITLCQMKAQLHSQ